MPQRVFKTFDFLQVTALSRLREIEKGSTVYGSMISTESAFIGPIVAQKKLRLSIITRT